MIMVWSLWRDVNVWLNRQVLSKNKELKITKCDIVCCLP